MNETLRTLKSRRSIKKFKGDPIPQELIEEIIYAGMNAPTGKNFQSPIMVLVTKKEDVDTLERMNAEILGNPDAHPFYGAPTVIVVLADEKYFTHVYDGALVMGNLLNAAHSLGVGACWIHRAKEMFESKEGKALLKKWGIPDGYEGIGNCVLGYRDCDYPAPKEKKKDYVYRV